MKPFKITVENQGLYNEKVAQFCAFATDQKAAYQIGVELMEDSVLNGYPVKFSYAAVEIVLN